ncbi:hypothetical protein [Enterococcus sp. AZ163]|uniref:hypothetical protein n=1 Tax=Enterococcus sp. AZ163 TaxID=2774638 RepID=UPI003D2E6194
MSATIFGDDNEYIEIKKSGDHIILDLGLYDSEDQVVTQTERVSFTKTQIKKVIRELESLTKGENEMTHKTIKGGIQLFQDSKGVWGTEITQNLKEDKELRVVFTSMIVENLAHEMGIPVRDMAEMLADNAEKNPMVFGEDEKTVNETYFEYGERFDAKNLSAAEDKFLDKAWGGAFANFLKADQNLSDAEVKIDVVEVLQEIEDKSNGYVKEVSKLENGMTMTFEVWMTEDEENPFLGQLTIVR